MRVVLDVSALAVDPPTGVQRVILQLLRGLQRQGRRHQYLLVAPRKPRLLPELPQSIFTLREVKGSRLWRQRFSKRIVNDFHADLWHSPVQAIPLRLPVPVIATVHELSWMESRRVRDEGWLPRRRAVTAAVARRADWVVCVSDRTRRNFLALHPGAANRCSVIHHGVDAAFLAARPARTRLAERYGLPEQGDYLLCVGRALRRKAYPLAVQALAELHARGQDWNLVLAGPRNPRLEAAAALATTLKCRDSLFLPGFIAEEDLPALYAGAAALLLPSASEGFGLPLLEAMAAGLPVVAQRAASLPEIAGDAAVLVDFLEPEAAADAIERLRGSESAALVARGRRRAAEFPEDGPARRLIQLWEDLHAG